MAKTRIGSLAVVLTAVTDKFNKNMAAAQTRVGRFSKAVSGAGGAMAGLLGGVAVTAGVTNIVRTFAEFEKSMSRVGALSGATSDQIAALSQKAQDLGSSTAFTASQAADAMAEFALAGFTVQEMLDATGPALNLAAAGGVELADSASVLSGIMRGFGIEATEAAMVGDVLTGTFTRSTTELIGLGESFKAVGPVAASANQSLHGTAAAIAFMGNNMIQGEAAGTALRNILLNLQAGTGEAGKAIETLKLNISDANGQMRPLSEIVDDINAKTANMTELQRNNIVAQIAGKKAVAAFTAILTAGGAELRAFEEGLRATGGLAQQIADQQLDNLSGSFTKLQSAIEGVKIKLGSMQGGGFKKVVDGITGAVQELSEWLWILQYPIELVSANISFARGMLLSVLSTLASLVSFIAGPLTKALKFVGVDIAEDLRQGLKMFAEETRREIDQAADDFTKSMKKLGTGDFSNIEEGMKKATEAAKNMSDEIAMASAIANKPTATPSGVIESPIVSWLQTQGQSLLGVAKGFGATFADAVTSGLESKARDLKSFAESALRDLMTPQQKLDEALRKLSEAGQAGLLSVEEMGAIAANLERNILGPNKLEQLAAGYLKEVMTPQEKFNEAMQQVTAAMDAGYLSIKDAAKIEDMLRGRFFGNEDATAQSGLRQFDPRRMFVSGVQDAASERESKEAKAQKTREQTRDLLRQIAEGGGSLAFALQ